ncbi:MAG TPA: crosslink repair DNA glycosylase YcaQ family protein [Mycobacteriales bacterium]
MSSAAAEGLSLGEVRRVAVGAGGLTTGFGDVTTALERLTVVQLDAINAVARAHQLTLATRVTGLTTTAVDEALWGEPDRSVAFEYPAHAASLVPITDWPLWGFRMRRTRTADIDWRPEPTARARIVAAIADQGPLTMRQLRGQDRAGNGWDWGPTKTAVEYLVWSGELACVRRQGWHRVFDLPERVIPGHLLDQDVDDHTCLVRLLTRARRALGVATVDDLADYLRIGRDRVLATVGDTPLRPVHVRGWKQQTWAHPDALSMLDGRGRPWPVLSDRSTTWSGTGVGSGGCSTSTMCWRRTSRRRSGSTGTTPCRCSSARAWSAAVTWRSRVTPCASWRCRSTQGTTCQQRSCVRRLPH